MRLLIRGVRKLGTKTAANACQRLRFVLILVLSCSEIGENRETESAISNHISEKEYYIYVRLLENNV